MFTNKKAKYNGDNKVLIDAACLSGDTKPTTGVANGSMTLEMDTGKLYAFDEANSEWLALSSGGGGGGGGGAEPLIVNFEGYEDETTCDHTLAEITAAFNSGRAVYATALDGDGILLPLILLDESGAVFELVRYSQTDTHGFVSFDSLTFGVDGEEVLVYASSNSGTFVLSNA